MPRRDQFDISIVLFTPSEREREGERERKKIL